MKRYGGHLVFLFSLCFIFSCGKKGPISPPFIRIPQTIEAWAAFQRGEHIVIEWTNPSSYEDGRPLPGVSGVELWVCERERPASGEPEDVAADAFPDEAKLAQNLTEDKFPEHLKDAEKNRPPLELTMAYRLPKEAAGKKSFSFGLRVRDTRGRKSGLSGIRRVEPKALPLPPKGVQTTVFEDRVEIRWEPPAGNIDGSSPAFVKGYNVYRSAGRGRPRLLNSSLVLNRTFDDRDFVFESNYLYFVRASFTETVPFEESEDSEPTRVVPRDVFPPSPPAGLTAISGAGMITLAWDANREKDLAGYRVWRKEEGRDDFQLLTPVPISAASFNDSAVEKNRQYHYAITALDRAGNESPKAEISPDIIREGFR